MNYGKRTKRFTNEHFHGGRTLGRLPRVSPGRAPYGSFLKSIAYAVTLGIMVITLSLAMVWAGTNTAQVHTSWSTKECVKVIKSDGSEGSCDNLPERYENIWVR